MTFGQGLKDTRERPRGYQRDSIPGRRSSKYKGPDVEVCSLCLRESKEAGELPYSSDGKECACSSGDQGSIPGLERSPGGENGNPLQCSCLVKPMDRGTWRATVHGITRSWTRLSD